MYGFEGLFLRYRRLRCRTIDPFGTPLKEDLLNSGYKQVTIIPYGYGSGFHLDYDLTSKDGKWNDLTLQMSFKKDAEGNLVPHFKDLHVM